MSRGLGDVYKRQLLMNNNPQTALNISNEISDFEFFKDNKIDIYRLIGFIHQDLGNYTNAIRYFEQSSNLYEGVSAYPQWLKNFKLMADCYYDLEDYSSAAKYYNFALEVHGMMHDIDMPYIQKDSKNKLKRKQTSYRTDEIDYILYQLLFCKERSGDWSTEAFLAEVTAMARAGNKYATRMLNQAGIDPYADCWR